MPSRSPLPNSEDKAIYWFVRARSPDFNDEERGHLEAWLSSDPAHARQFHALQNTWQALTPLVGELEKISREKPKIQRSWLPWSMGLITASLVIFLFLPPGAQLHQTSPGQHQTIALTPGISMDLDADSAVQVVLGTPPALELLRGKAYLSVQAPNSGGLEIRVGQVWLRDIGTRFAITRLPGGGRLAIAEGLVELGIPKGAKVLGAGQLVEFNSQGITGERPIQEADVAPWRQGKWHFSATSLVEIADEMKRQHQIILEIPTEIQGLTVSGNFAIDEPEHLLWAVAQVHGLHLEHQDTQHYRLRR